MTGPQRTFSPEFTAIYRADISGDLGRIVGPNTMGEYFQLVSVDDLGNGRWRGHFDLVPRNQIGAWT